MNYVRPHMRYITSYQPSRTLLEISDVHLIYLSRAYTVAYSLAHHRSDTSQSISIMKHHRCHICAYIDRYMQTRPVKCYQAAVIERSSATPSSLILNHKDHSILKTLQALCRLSFTSTSRDLKLSQRHILPFPWSFSRGTMARK